MFCSIQKLVSRPTVCTSFENFPYTLGTPLIKADANKKTEYYKRESKFYMFTKLLEVIFLVYIIELLFLYSREQTTFLRKRNPLSLHGGIDYTSDMLEIVFISGLVLIKFRFFEIGPRNIHEIYTESVNYITTNKNSNKLTFTGFVNANSC